jgi:dTDP-4-dehydrorhamnose 3,5-epimerase
MPFTFKRLEIPDIVLIEPKVFCDSRGFFMETYKEDEFCKAGIKVQFFQDNHSKSVPKGVLRGLHYQIHPKAQAKLIKVIKGKVFDVAVDLRKGSPTYGRWVSTELSGENKAMLYIPVGFAHGFCTLEENTEIIYKCSNMYAPEYDRGLIWNDPAIGIKWPCREPVLSLKDAKFTLLKDIDCNFIYV